MNCIKITGCLLLSIAGVHAQESINAGGGSAADSNIEFSYSIGQVFFEPAGTSQASVTPGVQQPYEILALGLSKIEAILNVYPNPATDYIELSFTGYDTDKHLWTLVDPSGRLIHKEEIKQEISRMEVKSLPTGVYYVRIEDSRQTVKTFKVIKR